MISIFFPSARGIFRNYQLATMLYLMEFGDQEPSAVIALFGVQYKDITAEKQKTISALSKLIEASVGHVDCVLNEQHAGTSSSCSTLNLRGLLGIIF